MELQQMKQEQIEIEYYLERFKNEQQEDVPNFEKANVLNKQFAQIVCLNYVQESEQIIDDIYEKVKTRTGITILLKYQQFKDSIKQSDIIAPVDISEQKNIYYKNIQSKDDLKESIFTPASDDISEEKQIQQKKMQNDLLQNSIVKSEQDYISEQKKIQEKINIDDDNDLKESMIAPVSLVISEQIQVQQKNFNYQLLMSDVEIAQYNDMKKHKNYHSNAIEVKDPFFPISSEKKLGMQIFIQYFNGTEILDVLPQNTIHQIKEQILEKTKIYPDILIFDGKLLKDNFTLIDYNIKHNDILKHKVYNYSKKFIEVNSYEISELQINQTSTVKDVMDQLEKDIGICQHYLNLIQLPSYFKSDELILKYINIKFEDNIFFRLENEYIIKSGSSEKYLSELIDDNYFRITGFTAEVGYIIQIQKNRTVDDLRNLFKNHIKENFLLVLSGQILKGNEILFEIKKSNQNLLIIQYSCGGLPLHLFDQMNQIESLPNKQNWLEDAQKACGQIDFEKIIKYIQERINNLEIENTLKEIALPITVYTSKLLYKSVNKALREGNYQQWLPYLQQFIQNIKYLPYFQGIVYRGVRNNEQNMIQSLKSGEMIIWKNIISLSQDYEVAKKFSKEDGVIYEVKVVSSRDISNLSLYNKEKEVVLLPFSYFIVQDIIVNQQPKIVKLKEIPVPRTLKFIIWVDDNPSKENYKYARQIELKHPELSFIFCLSTLEAKTVMKQYSWILHLEKSSIRIISDMVRKEESGDFNYQAGLDLAREFYEEYQFTDTKVLIFCNNVEKALDSLIKSNLDLSKVQLTKSKRKLNQFATFQDEQQS